MCRYDRRDLGGSGARLKGLATCALDATYESYLTKKIVRCESVAIGLRSITFDTCAGMAHGYNITPQSNWAQNGSLGWPCKGGKRALKSHTKSCALLQQP